MKLIRATVSVGRCTLNEAWTILVDDDTAQRIAEDPQEILSVADDGFSPDARIDIQDDGADNEEDRTVDPDSVEIADAVEAETIDLAFSHATLDARAREWLSAGSRVAFAAEQCVREYMRHHHPNAVKIDLYGEDVWTGENNEMRIHITEIHNKDGTNEPEDVVQAADEALEHPLLHLASVDFDDYYGESEITTIDTREAGA